MRANYQLMPYQLPTVTYAAGGRATSTLRDVPRQVGDAIAHAAAITFKVRLTPG